MRVGAQKRFLREIGGVARVAQARAGKVGDSAAVPFDEHLEKLRLSRTHASNHLLIADVSQVHLAYNASLSMTYRGRPGLLRSAQVGKGRIGGVLGREDRGSPVQWPIDPKLGIVPDGSPLGGGVVKRALFVEEDDLVGERLEAVEKALRYVDLAMLGSPQVDPVPPPVGRAVAARVYDHVVGLAGEDLDELAGGGSTVQAAHDVAPRVGEVVLHERVGDSVPGVPGSCKKLCEKAAIVGKDLRREDQSARER